MNRAKHGKITTSKIAKASGAQFDEDRDDSVTGYLITAMNCLADGQLDKTKSGRARIAMAGAMVCTLLALNRLDYNFDEKWFKRLCVVERKREDRKKRRKKVRR